jgi:hypothetical protein
VSFINKNIKDVSMRDKQLIVRLTENEYNLIKERAQLLGFYNVSEFVRYVSMNTTEIKRSIKNQ